MSSHRQPSRRDPGFAPADLTDGRKPYDWETRWQDKRARRHIRWEAIYLIVAFAFDAIAMLVVWLEWPTSWLDIDAETYKTFAAFAYSALGGLLGGVLFSMKWLYHSVAHGRWHQDRLLWRISSPIISAGLAVAVASLGIAGILPLVDADKLRQGPAAVGVSFLVGYFSDNTIAAMARMAERLFGEGMRTKTPTSQDGVVEKAPGTDPGQ